MANDKRNVLILGASYGSLLATKLSLAGHTSKMVCLPAERQLINQQGTVIRLPVRGVTGLVELCSRDLPGTVSACSAEEAEPRQHDLIVLAMQEPQYSVPEVRTLLQRVATSGVPCMSIMNMPPPPYLARLPSIDIGQIHDAYTDASVWASFKPALMTLASPDPQAFRPPDEAVNVLQVGLPTNFKVAAFESEQHTLMLRDLQADIDAVRYEIEGEMFELPVKLKVHDSPFVPLAKWLMLLTGNYRCVMNDGVRAIREAVHTDIDLSRDIYSWVGQLCIALGARADDLVPFDKYAAAAQGLQKPSSAARALAGGAKNIERVDKLVQSLARTHGMHHAEVDNIVQRVDTWLEKNRSVQAVV